MSRIQTPLFPSIAHGATTSGGGTTIASPSRPVLHGSRLTGTAHIHPQSSATDCTFLFGVSIHNIPHATTAKMWILGLWVSRLCWTGRGGAVVRVWYGAEKAGGISTQPPR